MEILQDSLTIFRAEWRRSLRSARVLLLLLLYVFFSLLVLVIVDYLSRAVQGGGFGEGALQLFAGDDPAALEALRRIPLLLLVLFRITLWFLPSYVALMGFDQLSGELGTRSIRYLTVRTHRAAIVMGKVGVQAAILGALLLSMQAAATAYAHHRAADFGLGQALPTLLRFWLGTILFTFAYLGLTALCSALFRAPAVSLVANVCAVFALDVLGAVGEGQAWRDRLADPPTTSWVALSRYLTPGHYIGGLLSPDPTRGLLTVLVYLAFTAAFILGAWAVLEGRDV